MVLTSGASAAEQADCHYSDWVWNSEANRAEDFRDVATRRSTLSPDLIHPDYPCSVCEEDQVEITLDGAAPFKVCHVFAEDIEYILREAQQSGFEINEVAGYRVGRTKGPLDDRGRRTQYSYHSFGVAIDINAAQNGLYANCVTFSPRCQLRRGGPWEPERAGTIMPGDIIYDGMSDIGLRWGGEIAGRQKDFMHFSPNGY